MLLKIFRLTVLVSVFLVMVSFVSAATCDVGEVKVVLRNNLFLHFTEPQASPLTLDEVRDLLIFYLGIDVEACSSTPNGVCPVNCAAGSDADCCTSAGKCWREGQGCYDTC